MSSALAVRYLSLASSLLAPCAAFARTCSIPAPISNGQVADAAKIMSNFNAIANCTLDAVSTTGTPIVGSIVTVSGVQTIKSADLSGDVTTSGGTVTTLANTGVVPGDYTNPIIKIDAKGRIVSATNGVSGGGDSSFLPPPASQFQPDSYDSTMPLIIDKPKVGMVVSSTTLVGSSDSYRLAYKALPAGSWSVTTRMTINAPAVNYNGVGLAVYNSKSKNVLSILVLNYGNRLLLLRSGSLSAYGTNWFSSNSYETIFWLRMSYNSQSDKISTSYSVDSNTWFPTRDVPRSDVFTTAGRPDRIGVTLFNSGGSDSSLPISVTVSNWQQSW